MKTFEINGYEVITNSDLTEGRGRSVHVAYTTNDFTAKQIAKGKGVMGTDAEVRAINKTIRVYETHSEYLGSKQEEIRKKALAKLTKEEKILLGLTDEN